MSAKKEDERIIVNVAVNFPGVDGILNLLGDLRKDVQILKTQGAKMDADIQGIIDQAQKNQDAESAAVTALNALFQKVLDLLKGQGPISAADRAAIVAKVADMKASSDAVAAAIVADTVPDTPPTP